MNRQATPLQVRAAVRFAPWAAWERSGLGDFPRLVLEAQVRADLGIEDA